MILQQSAVLLIARGFTYLSVLVLLPSFITITNPSEYADIVLLATLIGLAPILDGGQAAATSRRIAQAQQPTTGQKNTQLHIVVKATKDSLFWSLFISAGLVIAWMLLSQSSKLTQHTALTCIISTGLATLGNTCTRLLLVEKFHKTTAAIPILGPLATAFSLAYLRYLDNNNLNLIALPFALGAMIPIAYYTRTQISQHYKPSKSSQQFIITATSKKDNALRYSIFLSQIISIAVVAKNPLIIRIYGDDTALGQYSIFWAIHSLLIAPTAAMQAPLLTKFSRLHGEDQQKIKFYARPLARYTLIGIGLAAIIAFTIIFLNHFFSNLFAKNMTILNKANISAIYLCACIYITSIMLGTLLTATGNVRAINTIAFMVLLIDTILVMTLSKALGGITPLITMATSNIAGIAVVAISTRSRLSRHE